MYIVKEFDFIGIRGNKIGSWSTLTHKEPNLNCQTVWKFRNFKEALDMVVKLMGIGVIAIIEKY